jgi:hypothetical protein
MGHVKIYLIRAIFLTLKNNPPAGGENHEKHLTKFKKGV